MAYSLDRADISGTRIAMLAALIDADLEAAYDIAAGMLDEGVGFEGVVSEVLAPVQRELGARWIDCDLTIADEHAATATSESLVAMLAGRVSQENGPAVVVTCPAGDVHSLPARIVAATFALRGFRALFLGASMPAGDLGEFVAFQEPVALAMSVTMPSALVGCALSVAGAHAHEVPVVLGGRALGGSAARARKLGGDAFADDPAEAVDVVEAWILGAPETLASTPPMPSECDGIERMAARLVASAVDVLVASDPAVVSTMGEELARVLDVVRAALVLGEPEILDDHISALRAAAGAYGIESATLDAALSELAAASEAELPQTHALLVGAIT